MQLIDILDGTPLPIGYRMAFLTAFFREPLLRRMEREHGLIRPEWTILVCLAFRDGLHARDICEITEQPPNTISRGVASLGRKGLIARDPDPSDARRAILRLRAEGRRVHDAVMATFMEAEARMTASLSPPERETLRTLLDRMAREVPSWAARTGQGGPQR